MGKEKLNLGRRNFLKLTAGGLGISALSYYFGNKNRPLPSVPSENLPDYADGGMAFPVFRAPYFQKNVNLAAFLFRADVAKLTELCDQTVNTVEASPYIYVPLTSTVLLVYADMLVSSLDERDAEIGFIPETEIGFWVLSVAMKKTSRGRTPHHLAWFLPYLLVDEGNSISSGREVYGFNKMMANFQKPQEITSPQFAASVLGFKKFDREASAQNELLMELSATTREETGSSWKDWNSAKADIMGELIRNIRSDYVGSIMEFVTRAITDNIPLVFLKQFRDNINSKKAVYKAVIEAPLKVKNFYEGGLFSNPSKLAINHLDSHPFAEKLGLNNEQSSKMSSWMRVDFVLDQGVDVSSMA